MRSPTLWVATPVAATFLSVTAAAQGPLTTTLVVNGLASPLFVTHAPGDPTRLFVVEKAGRIRIVQSGTLLPTPFLDLSSLVNSTTLEWGLLGMCFDPGYATNGYFYVNYNSGGGGDTNIARFQVTADPNVASLASRTTILFLAQPSPNHRGGWLGFGPDGYLYDSQGDGGGQNDPSNRAQNLALLQGKLLRLDVSGDDFPADPNKNYRIPPTNPFVGQAGVAPEIFAYGLRNPWRCSFDRLTHDLWIADVGQNAREEVDVLPAGTSGQNFGWRCMEGTLCTGMTGCTCFAPSLTPPVHEYTHSFGVSITGGHVYRGSAIAGLQGTYFFADWASGRVWTLRWNGSTVSELTERTAELDPPGTLTLGSIAGFGEDAGGELYVCDLSGGELFKIVPDVDVTPPVVTITIPTAQPTYATSSALLALGGSATDDVGVTSVTWDSSSGANGTATGTTSWSVAGIPLAFGTNVLTVTARDAAGNPSTDVLTVTYTPAATAFCSGDGSATPCPCGNVGAAGRGCGHSANAAGAQLALSGAAICSADTADLLCSFVPSGTTCLFFQGTLGLNGDAGDALGDGLLCLDGALLRLGARAAGGTTASFGTLSGDTPISIRGQIPPGGGTYRYQTWYRNAAAFCTPSTFNLTQGLTVTWIP
jgi:glucose/arabinose dehydrogenase